MKLLSIQKLILGITLCLAAAHGAGHTLVHVQETKTPIYNEIIEDYKEYCAKTAQDGDSLGHSEIETMLATLTNAIRNANLSTVLNIMKQSWRHRYKVTTDTFESPCSLALETALGQRNDKHFNPTCKTFKRRLTIFKLLLVARFFNDINTCTTEMRPRCYNNLLHRAAQANYDDLVDWIIDAGANPWHTTTNGKYAYDLTSSDKIKRKVLKPLKTGFCTIL